jgi:hypothetical protein
LPKEIIIDNNIQIIRYFFKPKLIEYHEIKDITQNALYLKDSKVLLKPIKNIDDLISIIQAKLQSIGISDQFLEKKAEIKEEAQSKSLIYASLIVAIVIIYLALGGTKITAEQASVFVILGSIVLYPFIKMSLNKRKKTKI